MDLNNKPNTDLVDKCEIADKEISLQMKRPKKVLHFCDGTLEEFSDDDDDEIDAERAEETSSLNIDEKQLSWGPWIKLKSWKTGTTALAGIDYVGGAIASFLGITTSKYALEYEAFKENEKEKVEIEKEKLENSTWQESKIIEPNSVITTQIKKEPSERF